MVLNEDSEFFTFARPVGSSDIDVTLASQAEIYVGLERASGP